MDRVYIDRQMKGKRKNEWTAGWMDGWMDGWMEGVSGQIDWMDGLNGWKDGWFIQMDR